MTLRQFRPQMQTGRQDPVYATHTRTDHLSETVRDIGTELVLQVAQMTDNAISVDRRWFYYYKRKTVGRRCTCVQGEQQTRDGLCGICYGTGIVGGYDKYGTATEVIDSTYPGAVSLNTTIQPDPRPSVVVLDSQSRKGSFQVRVPLRSNASYVDNITVDSTPGVSFLMRADSASVWTTLTSKNFTAALSGKYVDVQVVLERQTLTEPAPIFKKLFIRYGLLPVSEIQIPGDIPPNTEAVSLEEYGFNEQFGTISVVMGSAGHGRTSKITTFSHDDFLFYVERSRHWKITEVKPNYALGVFTSFDITARWVQDFEVYKRFPV